MQAKTAFYAEIRACLAALPARRDAHLAPAAPGTGLLTVSVQHQPPPPPIAGLRSVPAPATLHQRRWPTEALDALQSVNQTHDVGLSPTYLALADSSLP
ncbi:MAG: hypothetical protein IID42_11425 [Planctomycetes bacterium]|nr:hypothetical protein [Planctomycetota bacterium]